MFNFLISSNFLRRISRPTGGSVAQRIFRPSSICLNRSIHYSHSLFSQNSSKSSPSTEFSFSSKKSKFSPPSTAPATNISPGSIPFPSVFSGCGAAFQSEFEALQGFIRSDSLEKFRVRALEATEKFSKISIEKNEIYPFCIQLVSNFI